MRVLFPNLKQYYQCRRLWPIYFFYGAFLWISLSLAQYGDSVALIVLMPLAFAAGWIVAAVQEEVASKPFSFCLPSHRQSLRRLVFLAGSIISAAGGAYFTLVHGGSGVPLDQAILMLCLGSCLTGVMFLSSAALTLAVGSGLMMSGVMLAVVSTSGLSRLWPDFDYGIVSHPFLMILAGVSAGVVVWFWLGRQDWLRERCVKPATRSLFTLLDSSPLERRRIATMASSWRSRPAVDGCFARIMRSQCPASVKYVSATIYAVLLPSFLSVSRWKTGGSWALLLLVILLVAGYEPKLAPPFILMLLLIAENGSDEGSPIFSNMLISGGRRERFYAGAICVGIYAVLLAGTLVLPAFVLNLLKPLLPEVRIGGSVFTFHHISLGLPMLSLIVFPISALVTFGLHGRRGGRLVIPIIWSMPLMFTILRGMPRIPVVVTVFIAGLSWLVFALGVYRIAMRGDLVRQ